MSALTFAANKFPESLEVDMAQDSDGDVMVINGEDFPLSQAPMEITLNPKTDKEGKIQEKYKKDKGKFFIEELSEAEEVLYLIPVAEIRRSRAYFEAYNKGENISRPIIKERIQRPFAGHSMVKTRILISRAGRMLKNAAPTNSARPVGSWIFSLSASMPNGERAASLQSAANLSR